MSLPYTLLALLVTTLWGGNFPVMKAGVQDTPPLISALFRFLVIVPLIPFFPRPTSSWKVILSIGFCMGTMISASVLAIHLGVSAGLCSLFYQTQVFLIVLLGIFFLKEKPTLNNWIGMSIGFLGIFLIALEVKGTVSLAGVLIILVGAFAIASVSITFRRIKEENMTSLMVWSSLGACPPILSLTEYFHGHEKVLESITHFSGRSIFAILYMSLGAGILGNTLWGLLLRKYPVALVAPFALLIPVLSLLFSYIFFGETLNSLGIFGTLLIIGGLVINELKFSPKSL